MRVLYAYRDFLRKGGMPVYSRALAAGVAAAGHDVAILSVDQPDGIDVVDPPEGVRVFRVAAGRAGREQFRDCLREFEPDLVHFTGGPRNWLHVAWGRAVRRAGLPYVVSGSGNLSETTFRYRWGGKPDSTLNYFAKKVYYYLFDRPFLRRAIAIHATSRNESEIVSKCGLGDAFVLPFSVLDESPADPQLSPPRSCRRPTTFTYLGRLSPTHKGLDVIVEAFGKVVAAGFGDRFRLIIAGPSESGSLEDLARRSRELGITNVSFPGPTYGADKVRLWSETDHFLHICRFTGFALATREALCEGIPVIATRESDYGDWVAEFNLGSVVAVDSGALAQAILGVLRLSDEAYRELSRNVMEYAWGTRWRDVGRLFADEYERLVGISRDDSSSLPAPRAAMSERVVHMTA